MPAVPFVRAVQDPGGATLGSTTAYVLFLGVILAVVLSFLLLFGIGQRRDRRVRRALAADLDRGFALLTRQLADLPGATVPSDAGQAERDARDRLAVARETAARGQQLPVLRAVRHTLLEGLAAAHAARSEAGLEAGAVPPPPNDAPLTDTPVDVVLGGRTFTAWPAYRPGSVHHFAGGTLDGVAVPGGWYAEAFWTELLTSERTGRDR